MSASHIALLRHGDYFQQERCPSAWQPHPLNPSGEQQAKAGAFELWQQAQALNKKIHSVIYCSPLLRSWQTAQILANELSEFCGETFTLSQQHGLCERSVGSLANLTIEQIEAAIDLDPRYPALPTGWKSDSHYCLPLPGAESLMQAGERCAKVIIEAVDQAHVEQIVAFVGHGAAMRHAAFHLSALKFEQIAALSMHHARPVLLQQRNPKEWQHCAGEWKQRKLKPEQNPNDSYTD